MNLKWVGLFAFATFAWLTGAALAAPPPGISDGWSDGFVYANGIRVHYYHAVPAPGKPVMVMVHGATDIALTWAMLAQLLQKSYDIYMPDTRGHGLSDPFTDVDKGDTLIKDTVEFVHAMNFSKPILVGHSMGAATVMRIGAEYPDLPKAVILLDPLLVRMPGRGLGVSALATASPGATAGNLTFAMSGPPAMLAAQNNYAFEDWVAKCGRDTPIWDAADCQYWALSRKQYHGPYTTIQAQAMTGTMSTADALARITAPTLILKADAPPETRKANEEAARVMKNGRLVHVDGAGHNIHRDERARTAELLTQFLDKL
jgi:pimeloyl-ACP methyl ester carboxylesterase